MTDNNIAEEITQGDSTPKASFKTSLINFFYAVTFSACLKVMVLRLIMYFSILAGIVLSIISSVILSSALVFFSDLVMYVFVAVGLFALTEIINRRTTK